MKNKLVFAAMLAMILAWGMTVVGCKDEPDNNNDNNNNNNNNNNGDVVTPTYFRVNKTGSIDLEFGVLGSDGSDWGSKSNSTLPGFTQTGTGGLENTTNSCGFSVTSGGAVKSIGYIYLASGGDTYLYINIMLPGTPTDPAFTAGQSVTLSYTPNGTHIFKRADGKTLGAFTLTANAQ